MVHPIRKPSRKPLENAILDYINLNRHKFDLSRNFDPRPDERDYVPLQLVKYVKPQGPVTHDFDDSAESYNLDNASADVEDDSSDLEHDERGSSAAAAAALKRRRISIMRCMNNAYRERGRCWNIWGKDSGYDVWMYLACMDRALERLKQCTTLGRYEKGIEPWEWKDMAMEDPSKPKQPEQIQATAPGHGPVSTNPNSDAGKSENSPNSFGRPWAVPVYRAPLMPPHLQRRIYRDSAIQIPPESLLRLGLMLLWGGKVGRAGPIFSRGGTSAGPGGVYVPARP
jgi:hypothetical protein